jgi:2-iminobutanoate/2-iminopropanoate deaminase
VVVIFNRSDPIQNVGTIQDTPTIRAASSHPNMEREAVTAPDVATPAGLYSHAVRVGAWLFISGQLPLDIQRRIVGTTPGEHAVQALENVRRILEAAGGTLESVVQVTIYITDVGHWPEVDREYRGVFGSVPVAPARAIVPVKELHFGALVEVQTVAYLNAVP